MRRIGWTAAAAIALTAGPATAAGSAAAPAASGIAVPPIAYTQRTLSNGLRVYSLRDTSTPMVSVQVWYEVGSKHDPEGRSGFAHLFEHILSRKTRNMPYNMINRLTEDVGGSRNASTWYDRTNYYETVPARYLETMLWTHAERMARPVVDAQVFETERNVVKEELRQRVLAPPYGRLFAFVLPENSFDVSPNRRPTIGSIADLDSATVEDARAFHEAYYGPDSAALIVSGNFDEAQLQRWVDQYFSAIPKRARPADLTKIAVDAPRRQPRTVDAYAPNVPLPALVASWRIPGSAHPDMAAITVLDTILTAGDSSRLNKALVYDKRVASSVGGNLDDIEDGGIYAPFAIVASGRGLDEAQAAFDAEIARVRTSPVTAAELAEAKNELLAAALRERETATGRAFAFGESLVRTGDPAALDRRLAAIARVTAADVQRVARAYLADSARIVIRYQDETRRPAGTAAGGWMNPTPRPRFATVPPAEQAAIVPATDAERQAPPAPLAASPFAPPALTETALANGAKVVVATTGKVPLAALTVAIRGGASTDPKGKAGLANFAANLATKGTATRSATQIAAELEALGASINTTANPDGVVFGVSAPVANLEAAGRILADILANASFPEAEIGRERAKALDGLAVAMKDPGAIAGLLLPAALYGDAPYGAPPAGTPDTLKALTRDDLVAQRDAGWRPDAATIVIAGGIDPAQASGIATRLFGGWRAGGAAAPRAANPAGARLAPRTIVVDKPGAGQAAVVAAVRGVGRAESAFYPLSLANTVLGAGSNGRLFQEVRVKRALSYGAYSSLQARRSAGALAASAQTKNESAADVAGIFLAEFDRLAKEPLAAGDVARRISFVQGNFARQAETSNGLAAILGGLALQDVPAAEATRFLDRVGGVTAEAASASAAATVSGAGATLIVVGDAAKFLEPLKKLRGEVTVIPVSSLKLDALP